MFKTYINLVVIFSVKQVRNRVAGCLIEVCEPCYFHTLVDSQLASSLHLRHVTNDDDFSLFRLELRKPFLSENESGNPIGEGAEFKSNCQQN